VGAWPAAFELATTYSAAESATAREPQLARHFVEMIAGPRSRCLREVGGFEISASVPSGTHSRD
jgi:molybdate transport system substrate-binding protein